MSNSNLVIVLAGGQSRRMGELGNKLLLPRDETKIPILAHIIRQCTMETSDVTVAYRDEVVRRIVSPHVSSRVRWKRDPVEWQGPLVALANVLQNDDSSPSSYHTFQVIAGDLPGLTRWMLESELRQLQSGHAEVVMLTREGCDQPLVAAYRWSVAQAFVAAVAAGESRILRVIERFSVNRLTPSAEWAWRINPVHTPADYHAWEQRRGAREAP